MKRLGAIAALGLVLAVLGSSPAHAVTSDDGDVAPQILEMMAEVPGGVVIDPNRAVWPELDMELFVPTSGSSSARSAVGGCATGKVCVFTGTSATGVALSWGTCGYHAVPGSFVARSVADARSSGNAYARAGSTVRAVAPAGGWANISGSVDNVLCTL